MVIQRSRQSGVSLIELMIAITILAILVVGAASLTGLWSKQAELDKATMSLKSAMGLSRATAIRNEYAQTADLAASQICFDLSAKKLSVHKATSTESASCTSPIVFAYALNQAIEIKNVSSTDFKCFAFNNLGQVITEVTENCKTNLSLVVSSGSLSEAYDLS